MEDGRSNGTFTFFVKKSEEFKICPHSFFGVPPLLEDPRPAEVLLHEERRRGLMAAVGASDACVLVNVHEPFRFFFVWGGGGLKGWGRNYKRERKRKRKGEQ